MSDPYTHRTPSTPPSRNFSHPHRQRAPTFSPGYNAQHNQGNPPMAPNDSNIFLPRLPTRVLVSHSTENLHSQPVLCLQNDPNSDFDFSYISPRRPSTAHTAFSSHTTPDLTLTALPQPQNQPPLPQIPHQFGCPRINPPSSRRLIKSPPRSPTKSAKSKKGSAWRNLGKKVKKVFSFGRYKNKSSKEIDGQKGPLEIGLPFNFEHRETHGLGPLRTAAPAAVGAGVMTGSHEHLTGNAMTGCKSSGVLNGRPGTGPGTGAGELGWVDEDGTAIEDDGDSTWEDYEQTRIFLE